MHLQILPGHSQFSGYATNKTTYEYVLTICFGLKIYDTFSLSLKYLLSPLVTKSTKRLFSIDEKVDSNHIKVFS